jgi:hypothetical protein
MSSSNQGYLYIYVALGTLEQISHYNEINMPVFPLIGSNDTGNQASLRTHASGHSTQDQNLEKVDMLDGPDPKTDTRDLTIKDQENDENWFMIDGGDENIIYDETSGGFWYSLWRNGDVEMVK